MFNELGEWRQGKKSEPDRKYWGVSTKKIRIKKAIEVTYLFICQKMNIIFVSITVCIILSSEARNMVGTFFKITQLSDTRQDCGPDTYVLASELLPSSHKATSYLLNWSSASARLISKAVFLQTVSNCPLTLVLDHNSQFISFTECT